MNLPFSLKQILMKPVQPQVLGLFRIIFGAFMIYEIIDYFRIGLVRNMFVLPAINFKYDYFKWLDPLPEIAFNVLLGILLLCACCITLGIFFKWACRIFAAGYLYIFLLDKSIYNNHIYLFILLAILLSLTDADKSISLNPNKKKGFVIPYWQQVILQFQFAVVYFYGGLAKLKPDWLLECQPMKSFIASFPSDHLLAPFIKNDFGIYLFNYGGLLLDLAAPFLLWNKRLKKWALIPIILFHAINSRIFQDIGIFPFVMSLSLILFFTPDELPFLNRTVRIEKEKKNSSKKSAAGKITLASKMPLYFLTIFVLFQLLFPFRGYFLPNSQDWTTIGNRFSWRMKIDTRGIDQLAFNVVDKDKNQVLPVQVNTLINDMQILNMAMDPRSVKDFAALLNEKARQSGIANASIHADIQVHYNGRQKQNFIEPDIDLTNVSYSPFKKLDWVKEIQN